MKEKSNSNNSLSIRRITAFVLDIILVSFAASVICSPFLDYDSIDNLTENFYELRNDYVDGEIDTNIYVDHSSSILYRMARAQGLLSLVSIFLNVLYFVVYQFYNKGQTLGKKMLGIKVVSNQTDELTMNHYIYRYFIINSVLIDMIILAFVILAPQNIWFYGSGLFGLADYIILFVCGLMIIFSKDNRGLHDLIADTKVVQYRK